MTEEFGLNTCGNDFLSVVQFARRCIWAWVDRVKQRRRETGETTPRQQTKFRRRVLEGREEYLAALDNLKTYMALLELRTALRTTAALSTLWREIDRLGFRVKKNGIRRRTTPR